MISCSYVGLGDYAALAWALTSLGYAIGLALHRIPLPGGSGSSWGGQLISYSLVSAAFVAVIGTANAFNTIVSNVQSAIGAEARGCESLPELYLGLGMKAFSLLIVMTGLGMASALIPIVGPAIANVFSVVASFPGLALSVTLITSFTLMTFLTVFGTLAVVLAPVGVALMAVPAGKLKGIGAWFIAAALVFTSAGPYIPAIGKMACEAERGVTCSIEDLVKAAVELAQIVGRKDASRLYLTLSDRIKHGVKEELLPLVWIPGVGRVRARALYSAGFRKPEDIVQAGIDRLSRIPSIGEGLALKIAEAVRAGAGQ
jgi:hypothetical protein